MYYIYTESGQFIDSRPTKEEADACVAGKNLYVRPSTETLALEKARQEFKSLETLAVQL